MSGFKYVSSNYSGECLPSDSPLDLFVDQYETAHGYYFCSGSSFEESSGILNAVCSTCSNCALIPAVASFSSCEVDVVNSSTIDMSMIHDDFISFEMIVISIAFVFLFFSGVQLGRR
jgi:hypothetical protein